MGMESAGAVCGIKRLRFLYCIRLSEVSLRGTAVCRDRAAARMMMKLPKWKLSGISSAKLAGQNGTLPRKAKAWPIRGRLRAFGQWHLQSDHGATKCSNDAGFRKVCLRRNRQRTGCETGPRERTLERVAGHSTKVALNLRRRG